MNQLPSYQELQNKIIELEQECAQLSQERAKLRSQINEGQQVETLCYAREHLETLVGKRTRKIQETNEELQKSEEKFRTVADFTYDWEWWINPAGKLVYISPSCQRISGYDAEEFINNPDLLLSITHAQDREPLARHLKEKLLSLEVCHLDFRIIRRDGTCRQISLYCQPVMDLKGNHLGQRGSNRDITDRIMAEEALRKSEKLFRLALDATSDGVWDKNLVTGEVYYGENWARILKYTSDEVRRTQLTWEKLLHPDDEPKARKAVDDHVNGKTSRYRAEFRMRNKIGDWQWIHAKGKVVEWDNDGTPIRFVGTHTDISDRKRAEEALKKSSEKIKIFAYSVVHDLKNPAIAIYGLAKRLHDKYEGCLGGKGLDFCDQIVKCSEQIAALVEQVNVYISTKEKTLTIDRFRLTELLRMIREEFAVPLNIRQIDWIEPEQQPEIKGDRLDILRVLRNFVDNALKHGGEKLSRIEIGYQETQKSHILLFTDNGVGITQEDTENIFGIFHRQKTAANIEGAGLGLAIVKEIAEQHHGEVRVEAGQENGTCFSISLAKHLPV